MKLASRDSVPGRHFWPKGDECAAARWLYDTVDKLGWQLPMGSAPEETSHRTFAEYVVTQARKLTHRTRRHAYDIARENPPPGVKKARGKLAPGQDMRSLSTGGEGEEAAGEEPMAKREPVTRDRGTTRGELQTKPPSPILYKGQWECLQGGGCQAPFCFFLLEASR